MRQIHDVVDKPCVSCEVLGFQRGAVEVFAVQECCAGVDSYFISNYQSTRTFKRTHLP